MSESNLNSLSLNEFKQHLKEIGVTGIKSLREKKMIEWSISPISVLSDFFVSKFDEVGYAIGTLENFLEKNPDRQKNSSFEKQFDKLLSSIAEKFHKLIISEPTAAEIKTIFQFEKASENFQIGFMIAYLGEKSSAFFSEVNQPDPEFYRGLTTGALYKSPFHPNNIEPVLTNLNNRAKDIEEIINKANQDSNRLYKLYEEKLRFDSPANYWNKTKDSYKKQAGMWYCISLLILVASVVAGGIVLSQLGSILPANQDQYLTIKATVILSVLVSIVYYAIYQTFKLSLSAFHLQRDAEEREQLTHLYLSLKNENAVEQSDRIIILQALFSRADTGLIKSDSASSIPNAITNAISSINSRKDSHV